jgi:thioredoxin-related protein
MNVFFRALRFVILVVLCMNGVLSADELWLTNMDEALAAAKKDGRPILIDFTGSDWCVWCVRLDSEVFDTDRFRTEAPKRFVLVKLDFPRHSSILTPEEKAHNQQWSKKFGINGFPTILLLDAEGRPFAKTGYQEGGEENYLNHLTELENVLNERNQRIEQADGLEGVARAKKLDEALELLDESIATAYYQKWIDEIGELDRDDEAGLRTKYFAQQDLERQRSLLARIRLAGQRLQPERALQTIDDALAAKKLPPEMRLEALQIKLQVLRSMRRSNAIIATLDEMLELEGLPSEAYQKLLVQKAYGLVAVARDEDAIALLTERIDSTLQNQHLHAARGELYSRLGRHQDALEDFKVVQVTPQGEPEFRMEIGLMMADSLIALEQTKEATQLLEQLADDEQLPSELQAEVLVQAAMIYRELGQSTDAKTAEARALDKVNDPKEQQRIRALIEQLGDGI